MDSRLRLCLLTIAAIAGTALSGGVAWGAGRTAVPAEATVAGGTTGSVIAYCPRGTRAISGGFAAPDFDNDGTATVRYGSMRTGKRNWQVDAAGLSENAGRIVAHAYCQKPPQGIRIVRATAPIGVQSVGSTSAVCAPNEQAISGGFTAPGFSLGNGPNPIVLSSYRSSRRSWYVQAFNFTFDQERASQPGEISAYAFCRRRGPAVSAHSVDVNVGIGSPIKTIDTPCPPGTWAISGGFDAHITPLADGFSAAGPIGSVRLPAAAGWQTTLTSVSEVPATGTGYAYCQAVTK